MLIRPETPADYSAIADIHIQAFQQSYVAAIVALLRQRPSFRADFSLLAEIDGKPVGHIVFTPDPIVYLGKIQPAVTLSPLGVLPEYQKQGIGAALVREGHRLVQEQGFELALVLGHPTYYPHFGYETHAFGASSVTLKREDLPESHLESREAVASDIPALMALWQAEEGQVEFAMRPNAHLADWLSPHPAMQSLVYLKDGELLGYSRGKAGDIRAFYAKSHEAARMMARHLAGENPEIVLPLHPNSASAQAFSTAPQSQAWDAGMLCRFNPSIPKSSVVGRPIWPAAFDLG